MRYNIGGDYVFPLVDAAYRTLVIFVYIVITLSAYQLVPRKRPFASRIEVFDVVARGAFASDPWRNNPGVSSRRETPSKFRRRRLGLTSG
jgi:hypothetical protein